MSDTTATFDPRQRDGYLAWTAIPVRFGDQDTLGHVNNVAIAGYLEHARCTFLVPTLKGQSPVLSTVLARIAIDYFKEIHFPGTVDVGIRITRVGIKSFVIAGGVFSGADCCATSEATMVFFDPLARRSTAPLAVTWDRLASLR